MRDAHGPLVKFWLVSQREFLILSMCDLATRLLYFYNRLFGAETGPAGQIQCLDRSFGSMCIRAQGLNGGSSDPTSPRRKASLFNLPPTKAGGFFFSMG